MKGQDYVFSSPNDVLDRPRDGAAAGRGRLGRRIESRQGLLRRGVVRLSREGVLAEDAGLETPLQCLGELGEMRGPTCGVGAEEDDLVLRLGPIEGRLPGPKSRGFLGIAAA